MPTIICTYCQYVGSGESYNDRINDVMIHEQTCSENTDTDNPELTKAAKKAAATGSKTDLHEYLKLRRNFI